MRGVCVKALKFKARQSPDAHRERGSSARDRSQPGVVHDGGPTKASKIYYGALDVIGLSLNHRTKMPYPS